MYADSVNDMLHPTNASESYPETTSAVIVQALETLPIYFNLSDSVIQLDQYPRVGGGYFDLYRGYSRDQCVGIRRLRCTIGEPTSESVNNRLARELTLWSDFDHKNILPLLGYTIDMHGTPSFIVEWMEHGHIMDYLRKNSTADLISLTSDIAAGLSYLHGLEIVHADMKPSNVLITSSGSAVVTDFGLSRFLTPTLGFITSGGLKGTTGYWAIEIVRKLCHAFKEVDNETQGDDTQEDEEPTMDCHTQQSDVWAFGMTVYAILADGPPYANMTYLQTVKAICRRRLPKPGDGWGEDKQRLWEVCTKCWDVDPTQRPTMDELCKEIAGVR